MTTPTDDLSDSLLLMEELDRSALRFGRTLSTSFAGSVKAGKDLRGVLADLQGALASLALRAAFRPIGEVIASGIAGLARQLAGSLGLGGAGAPLSILPSAKGNVIGAEGVRPFASGGVVAAPTWFPLGRGVGLMGERGAEAILPLARGPDGRLGVRQQGGGPVSVTVNVTTPDVEGFRRAEAQVAAALARAVGRGRRGL